MRKLLLILFLCISANLFAQDYIVTNDGRKVLMQIKAFDIYSLTLEKPEKHEFQDVANIQGTTTMQAFYVGGINFYLTDINEGKNLSRAFLPTDSSFQNIELRTNQIDLSKYNSNDITFYKIKLSPNHMSEAASYLFLGVGGLVAAGEYNKERGGNPRNSEVTLLFIKKGEDTLQNLTSQSWAKTNNCWNFLKGYFADNSAIEAELDDYIQKNKPATAKNINKVILEYMDNPKIKFAELHEGKSIKIN